jgi:hypothetical protein
VRQGAGKGAGGAATGVAGAAPPVFLVDFRMLNSTRRFCCLPFFVVLSAMGFSAP